MAEASNLDSKEAPVPLKAWAFLALAAVLNLIIGSCASFSYWKIGFKRHFAAWDHSSLSSVYSWGVFGGFICVIPGLLFDKFGPRATAIYGLLLVNIGFAGMIVLSTMGGNIPAALVGFFYFLEEQGASAALYMVTVCVLVRVFPSRFVGIVSGAVAVAYGLSGLMWQKVGSLLFGFTESPEPAETNVIGFLMLMLLATDVAGVPVLIFAPLVLAENGLSADKDSASAVPVGIGAAPAPPSIWDTILSWDFACLIMLYSVVSSQVINMMSYLSSIPTAFESLSAAAFSPIPFAANVGGRILYAGIVSLITNACGRPGICAGNVWINACYIFCFLVLVGTAGAGEGPAWLMMIAFVAGFSAYGGGVCFASSFVKLSFFEDHVGIAIGLLFTMAAIVNTTITFVASPGNSQGSKGVDRVPLDFVRPWTAAMVLSVCALPLSLVVLCLARKHKRPGYSETSAELLSAQVE